MNSGKEFSPVFAFVFTALRRAEPARSIAPAECGMRPVRPQCQSGAKATAGQTLARPLGISTTREAFGLRRVHRRFLPQSAITLAEFDRLPHNFAALRLGAFALNPFSVQRDAAADVGGNVEVFALVDGRLALVEPALGDDGQRQLGLEQLVAGPACPAGMTR